MNIYKNKTVQTMSKLFPVAFLTVCTLMYAGNQLCVLAGVI